MAKFGLITEGITDQIVIENILCGFYRDYDDLDEEISPLEPPRDETDMKQAYSEFGTGWSAIFNYLSETRCCEDKLKKAVAKVSKKLKVDKNYKNYDKLSQKFLKNKELIKISSKNISFQIFINRLPKNI